MGSTRSWKHSFQISIFTQQHRGAAVDVSAVHSSSTSQKCCTGLRFDEWWGHWTTRTQCHVQKQKVDMIWALYHGMLSCWYTVVIKDWTSSTIILNHAVAFKQTSVVPRGPKGTHTRQDGSTLLCCLCQFLNLPSECHIEVHTHQTG